MSERAVHKCTNNDLLTAEILQDLATEISRTLVTNSQVLAGAERVKAQISQMPILEWLKDNKEFD